VLRDAVRCRSLRHVRNPICRAVLIDIVVLGGCLLGDASRVM